MGERGPIGRSCLEWYATEMARRLLLVEDDDDIREVVVEDLGERGYLVHGTPNGSVALQALRAYDADARGLVTVVLDLMMPVMDGWEFLRELRGDAELRHLRVVVTTGSEDVGGLPKDVHVLRKPYTMNDLVRAIERTA